MKLFGMIVAGLLVLSAVTVASAASGGKLIGSWTTYEPEVAIQNSVLLDEDTGKPIGYGVPGTDVVPTIRYTVYGNDAFADYMFRLTVTTPSGQTNTIELEVDADHTYTSEVIFPAIGMGTESMTFFFEGYHRNVGESGWKKDTQYTERLYCLK